MKINNLFFMFLIVPTTLFFKFEMKAQDVYVAGRDYNNPELWKNGVRQNLEGGPFYYPSSVFVYNDDVYVVGRGSVQAVLWKNGIKQSIKSSPKSSDQSIVFGKASSVFVLYGTVYIAVEETQEKKIAAALWINDRAYKIDNKNKHAGACDVYVSGGNNPFSKHDIYVAGWQEIERHSVATLWKNGKAQILTDGRNKAIALSVFVSENKDVYVAGYEGKIAKLWKNGVAQNLTDGRNEACASSVFVSENKDVYVVGYDGKIAKLWKNGVEQNLSDGINQSYAKSVFVYGNDVYVAGQEEIDIDHSLAILWKNGVVQKLTDGRYYSTANSVFVK